MVFRFSIAVCWLFTMDSTIALNGWGWWLSRFWLECSVGCICDASCSEIPLIGELAIGFVTPCVLSVSESVFNCSITVFVVVELLLLISLLLALLLLFVLSVQLLLLLVFFFSFVFVCYFVVGLVVFFLNLWAILLFFKYWQQTNHRSWVDSNRTLGRRWWTRFQS